MVIIMGKRGTQILLYFLWGPFDNSRPAPPLSASSKFFCIRPVRDLTTALDQLLSDAAVQTLLHSPTGCWVSRSQATYGRF